MMVIYSVDIGSIISNVRYASKTKLYCVKKLLGMDGKCDYKKFLWALLAEKGSGHTLAEPIGEPASILGRLN